MALQGDGDGKVPNNVEFEYFVSPSQELFFVSNMELSLQEIYCHQFVFQIHVNDSVNVTEINPYRKRI